MNFNNFRYKMSEYFRDSYGWDRFSKYLFGAGAILTFVKWFFILGYGLIGYAFWRTISKNKQRRYLEGQAFEKYLYSLKHSFSGVKYRLTEGRKYKIFNCPNCGQKLRVPRKHGNIIISCRKCGREFKAKS